MDFSSRPSGPGAVGGRRDQKRQALGAPAERQGDDGPADPVVGVVQGAVDHARGDRGANRFERLSRKEAVGGVRVSQQHPSQRRGLPGAKGSAGHKGEGVAAHDGVCAEQIRHRGSGGGTSTRGVRPLGGGSGRWRIRLAVTILRQSSTVWFRPTDTTGLVMMSLTGVSLEDLP